MHLRHWSDDREQVWASCLDNGYIFKTHTRNICARRDYYEMSRDTSVPYSLEKILSEEIEGPATKPLEKLSLGEIDTITPVELDSLCLYLGIQIVRTPFTHKKMDQLSLKLDYENMLKTLHDDEKFRQFEHEWRNTHPDKKFFTQAELIEAIESKRVTMKIVGNDHNLSMIMPMGLLMKDSYRNQRWTLLRAPDKRAFICSDHPVVTMTGRTSEGDRTETVVPISPRYCLLLEKNKPCHEISIQNIDHRLVREINSRIALHAQDCLIAQDEALLRRMLEVRTRYTGQIQAIRKASSGAFLDGMPFASIGRTFKRLGA